MQRGGDGEHEGVEAEGHEQLPAGLVRLRLRLRLRLRVWVRVRVRVRVRLGHWDREKRWGRR